MSASKWAAGFGCEQWESFVDELLRARGICLPSELGLAERGQGKGLSHPFTVLARLHTHLLHLDLDGGEVEQSPRGAGGDIPRG